MRSGRTSWKHPRKACSSSPSGRDVAPAAAGPGVPVVDARAETVRSHPADEQLRVGVRPEQLLGGPGEVAGDVDDRHGRVGLDTGLGHGGHEVCSFVCVGRRCRVHLGEHGVQAAVALLGGAPVPLDPLRHQLQHLGFEVHRPPLGVTAAADQPGVLQHLQVLGDRLHAHLIGLRELADRGVPDREPRHDVAPGRVRQGCEEPGQLLCHDPSSTNRLNTGYDSPTSVVNHLVEYARRGRRPRSVRQGRPTAAGVGAAGSPSVGRSGSGAGVGSLPPWSSRKGG